METVTNPRRRKGELLTERIQVLFTRSELERLEQVAAGMPFEGNLSKMIRSIVKMKLFGDEIIAPVTVAEPTTE